jgi:hypothetical protein
MVLQKEGQRFVSWWDSWRNSKMAITSLNLHSAVICSGTKSSKMIKSMFTVTKIKSFSNLPQKNPPF